MHIRTIRRPSDAHAAWREAMHAAERELDQNGRVVAKVVFFRRRGSPFSGILFGDGDARARTLHSFQLKAIAEDVVAIILSTEVWKVDGELEPGVSAAQSDRRYECLTVVALTRHSDTGELICHFGSRVIERGPGGKASLSGDWVRHDNRLTHTLVDDVLPLRRPTPLEQMLAQMSHRLMEPQLTEDRKFAETV